MNARDSVPVEDRLAQAEAEDAALGLFLLNAALEAAQAAGEPADRETLRASIGRLIARQTEPAGV